MPERPREKEELVVRETSEAADCHLGDMLQQLHSVNASKPSERGLVRQGGCCTGPGAVPGAGACRLRFPGGQEPGEGAWALGALASPVSDAPNTCLCPSSCPQLFPRGLWDWRPRCAPASGLCVHCSLLECSSPLLSASAACPSVPSVGSAWPRPAIPAPAGCFSVTLLTPRALSVRAVSRYLRATGRR